MLYDGARPFDFECAGTIRPVGFLPMPDGSIGPELRALIEHQSGYLDPRTRETLWRQFHRS